MPEQDLQQPNMEHHGHDAQTAGAPVHTVNAHNRTSAPPNRKILYLGVALIIIIAFVALIALQIHSANKELTSYDNVLVPAATLSKLTHIPNNISNRIGIGEGVVSYSKGLSVIKNKTELMLNGKPEIFYLGADYCPFCAAERWAYIIALSRFGNFTNLRLMTSSASDYAPSSPTFSFYNSTYTSPYLTFVSVEEYTNKISGSYYAPLQQPTSFEMSLAEKYNPGGSIPFFLMANRSVISGSTFDPYIVIYGMNWSTIVNNLYNTSSLQSQAIVGSANLLTEQICGADNNTPASVCDQPYITIIRKTVGS